MISRNLSVKLRFSEKRDGSGNFPRLNVDVTKFGISAVLYRLPEVSTLFSLTVVDERNPGRMTCS